DPEGAAPRPVLVGGAARSRRAGRPGPASRRGGGVAERTPRPSVGRPLRGLVVGRASLLPASRVGLRGAVLGLRDGPRSARRLADFSGRTVRLPVVSGL